MANHYGATITLADGATEIDILPSGCARVHLKDGRSYELNLLWLIDAYRESEPDYEAAIERIG